MRKLSLFLLLLLVFTSCNNKKEKEMEEREKAVKIRENRFAEKEADYLSLLKMRDSLLRTTSSVTDSIAELKAWPDTLQHAWNSKMICIESNCVNYVIGDQRNEIWQFLADSVGLYTHVLSNKKLVRTFSAKYKDNKIFLHFSPNTATSTSKIDVVLDEIKKDVIKGTQTITGQDNCTSKFSVELTPSTKQ